MKPLKGTKTHDNLKAAFAGESDLFKRSRAGQIAHAPELAIFLAPTINSYKRFPAGS